MLEYLPQLTVIVLTIVSAILAVESKDLLRALISFIFMSVFLSMLFYMLGTPYVSVFQLAIYAGAIAVLFLATLHTMRRMKL